MKSALPVLLASLLFASCTTAYKSGQTPDDVYYSPARERAEYVNTEERTASQKYRSNERYDEFADEDRYLRMKVYNRSRWSALDNDWCTYNRYGSGYGNYYYNNSWSSYSYWNYFYNPYYTNVIVVNPKSPVYSTPRRYNLHVFDNPQTDPKTGQRTYGSYNSNRNNDNYRGSGSNAGNYLRDAFSNSNSNSNSGSSNNNSTPARSSSSSGSSSSGSGSSGGNAPVRKF